MKKHYSITIITSSFNASIPLFTQVLENIKAQKYKGALKHIILDGGSTNGTVELAKKYHCQVLSFTSSQDEGTSRLYKGMQYVNSELVLLLETDNILPDTDWLTRLVEPFSNPAVVSTYPAYNMSGKNSSMLSRYFALIGSPDPVLYYLGKSDKIPVYKKKYDKGEILEENKNYFTVRFTRKTLPTLGDNGYIIRTKLLKKIVYKNKPFIHVDAFMELLEKGHDTYGVVKNSIIHESRSGIVEQIKRRVAVKEYFTDQKKTIRKYKIIDWQSQKDKIRLILFVLFSLTFVQPLFISTRGYLFYRDIAWFLHPLVSFGMMMGYGISEIKRIIGIKLRLIT